MAASEIELSRDYSVLLARHSSPLDRTERCRVPVVRWDTSVVSSAPAGSEVIQISSSFLERSTASPRERQLFQHLSAKMEPGPAGISNFSPMDGASDNQFEIGAVTAEPA